MNETRGPLPQSGSRLASTPTPTGVRDPRVPRTRVPYRDDRARIRGMGARVTGIEPRLPDVETLMRGIRVSNANMRASVPRAELRTKKNGGPLAPTAKPLRVVDRRMATMGRRMPPVLWHQKKMRCSFGHLCP